MISLIIPVRSETPDAAERFRPFLVPGESEVVVAAGEHSAETSRAFEAMGAGIVCGQGSRGIRLDRAARQARGEIFFFVHADSRPPANALSAIQDCLQSGAAAGAFSLAYENATPALKWIAWWANARSRLLRLPFGDQGLFCRRDAYERSGGYRDLAICEDVDIVRRLKRAGPFAVLRDKTVTSPRRYRERGALRQVLRNWKVLLGYFAGVSSQRLERWYNAR